MSDVREVIGYLCSRNKLPLSKMRLAKLLYLADWTNAQKYGQQLTDLQWRFNRYGPYADNVDIVELARNSKDFDILRVKDSFGSDTDFVKCLVEKPYKDLSSTARETLDSVLHDYYAEPFQAFSDSVLRTYPLLSQKPDLELDLPKLAQESRHRQFA
jgi:hypothetical protein